MNKQNVSLSQKIAIGGISTALSFIMLYISSWLPTATISFAAIAGLPIAYVVLIIGKRFSLAVYFGVSLLSLMLTTDKSAAFMFVALFGIYPVLKAVFEIQKSRITEWILKIAFALLSFTFLIFVLKTVFRLPEAITGSYPYFYILFIMAFVLYDIVFSMLITEMAARFTRR